MPEVTTEGDSATRGVTTEGDSAARGVPRLDDAQNSPPLDYFCNLFLCLEELSQKFSGKLHEHALGSVDCGAKTKC